MDNGSALWACARRLGSEGVAPTRWVQPQQASHLHSDEFVLAHQYSTRRPLYHSAYSSHSLVPDDDFRNKVKTWDPTRGVHGSILCDLMQPNPSADWPNPTQPITSGKIWTQPDPIQPNPTHGSSQPMDNSGPDLQHILRQPYNLSIGVCTGQQITDCRGFKQV